MAMHFKWTVLTS